MNSTADSLTIVLPDGRKLGYAELGDPEGFPLFFFHGTPGSRFVLSRHDALSQMSGIRLILPERPGYGLSDPKPGRTLLDWAEDVTALAGQLDIGQFAVAGISGGGPYALACASALPGRVTAALLLASSAPANFRGVTRGMSLGNRLGLVIGRYAPGLLRWSTRSFASAFCENPKRFLATIVKQFSAPDQKLMEDPVLCEAIVSDLREAYRQGGDGHADDGLLAMTSGTWGFDLAEIRVPVYLWHGEADTLVSRPMAEYLAATLPNCEAHFVANAGHLLTEYDEVVETFAAALRVPVSNQLQ